MARPFPPLMSAPLPRRPLHRPLPHEAHESAARARAAEDAVVLALMAQLGVRADDLAGQRIERTPTVAELRHLVRVAYRRGREARG